ncbi:MAG: hypothetical protein J5J06_05630 [Phycisphaerae bacterium]|nr:hypothetical protein [Phycisphaerae bacterium]
MGQPVAGNKVSPTRRPDPGRRTTDTHLAGPPTDYAGRPIATSLLLETDYASDAFVPAPETMRWESFSEGMDGAETTLRISGGLSAEKLTGAGLIGDGHFSQVLEQLDPARRVRVIRGAGGGEPLPIFEGFPNYATVQWSARDQRFDVGCTSTADELLDSHPDAQLLGRTMRRRPESIAAWQADAPDMLTVDALALAYNADGKPNRAAETLPIETSAGTFNIYLHTEDDGDGAGYWNYAAALTNLLVLHVLRKGLSVSVVEALNDLADLQSIGHAAQSPDPFTRRLTARVASVTCRAVTIKEALALLCHAAGIHYHLPIRWDRATKRPAYWLRLLATLRTDAEERATPPRFSIGPRVDDLPRLAPLTDTASDQADEVAEDARAAFDAVITRDNRMITRPTLAGDVQRFEVTLLLRPGWRPIASLDNINDSAAFDAEMTFWRNQFDPEFDEETGKPLSIYHQQHPQFHTVRDVGRLWIFPDTDRYPGNVFARINGDLVGPGFGFDAALYSPFSGQTQGDSVLTYFDADIGGNIPLLYAAKWVMRPRPFTNTIGREGPTDERSPIVRFCFDCADPRTALATGTWVRYRGTVRFDAHRAALWIDEDNLLNSPALAAEPNDPDPLTYLEAYLRGTLQVAVTCVVEGDERLLHAPVPSPAPMPRPRARVVDVSERFAFDKRRGQNSHLDDLPTDEERFETRDDTAALVSYGTRFVEESARAEHSGPVSMPWIDDRWRIGDSFSGVQGLGIPFTSFPAIVRREIAWDPEANGYKTTYHLADLRHEPEADSEQG